MANIQSKEIIAGTAKAFKASIEWGDLDDVHSWLVSYEYIDATGTVIKTATQPVPSTALQSCGMTLAIANNIRKWVADQAGVTITTP